MKGPSWFRRGMGDWMESSYAKQLMGIFASFTLNLTALEVGIIIASSLQMGEPGLSRRHPN